MDNQCVQMSYGVNIELIKNGDFYKYCVLGVLENELGLEIKKEMLDWISEKYNVFVVTQKAPGKLFEYPALGFTQLVSIKYNQPILYLHTKGAANPNGRNGLQSTIRKLWKNEFIDHYYDYWNTVLTYKNKPIVACPMISNKNNITWWNGFIANSIAYKTIGTLPVYSNRFRYESIFTKANVSVFGRLSQSCVDGNTATSLVTQWKNNG